MIVHKTTAIGITEFVDKPKVNVGFLQFTGRNRYADVARNFSQLGHTESQLDWLMEQIRTPARVHSYNLRAKPLSLAIAIIISKL